MKKKIISKLRSVWLFMSPHPENEEHSEMNDRLTDVEEVIEELEKFPRWRKIDTDNLPVGSVVMLLGTGKVIIGEIVKIRDNRIMIEVGEDYLVSESYSQAHYIPVSELLNLEKED